MFEKNLATGQQNRGTRGKWSFQSGAMRAPKRYQIFRAYPEDDGEPELSVSRRERR